MKRSVLTATAAAIVLTVASLATAGDASARQGGGHGGGHGHHGGHHGHGHHGHGHHGHHHHGHHHHGHHHHGHHHHRHHRHFYFRGYSTCWVWSPMYQRHINVCYVPYGY